MKKRSREGRLEIHYLCSGLGKIWRMLLSCSMLFGIAMYIA